MIYQWRVYIEIKSGFNPVSMLWYAALSYREAFAYFETRKHLITKKRKVFVKQQGSKYRHYEYDERFAAALEVEDVDSDEWYDEPTDDGRASVQLVKSDIHSRYPVAKWRGVGRL